MVKNRCLYRSAKRKSIRSNNSYAITKEELFIQLVNFIVDELTVKEYTIRHELNTKPVLNIDSLPLREIENISPNLIAVETNSIEKICVFIEVDDALYICAVPNLYFY